MGNAEIRYHTQEMYHYSNNPSTTDITLISIFFYPFENFLLYFII